MNKLTIIGNLTRDPETRVTAGGKNVCTFTVAVNRRVAQKEETDFFRVSAWEKTADLCQRYLSKGRKVAIVGPVSLNTYTANNGENRANLEVYAETVEFLGTKNEASMYQPETTNAKQPTTAPEMDGYEEVEEEDLPF
jgi:single-strand DNA-binding protein